MAFSKCPMHPDSVCISTRRRYRNMHLSKRY
jgi:hypothetical protein